VKPRALVCEDDPTLRSVVGDLVEAHGWTATVAATATDAIDQANRLHPDLVVLDIGLVGMSGLESIPRLRAGSPHSRVVAMSLTDRGLELCLDAGACAVVTTSDLGRLDELLTDLEVSETAA
jgi:DNA-binding response OmpR family regulator